MLVGATRLEFDGISKSVAMLREMKARLLRMLLRHQRYVYKEHGKGSRVCDHEWSFDYARTGMHDVGNWRGVSSRLFNTVFPQNVSLQWVNYDSEELQESERLENLGGVLDALCESGSDLKHVKAVVYCRD